MPFAGYEDFEECVEDNQNLDNPEAFCAWLEERAKNGKGRGKMKTKILNPDDIGLKFIESEDGAGYIEGYASVFGNVDNEGDVVEKGAFSKTIQERLEAGKIKFVDFHNSTRDSEDILGVVEEAEEDEHGLKFKAKLSETERAQNVRKKVQEGILDALSIGYDVIEDEIDREKGVRYLKELKLWEVSVVSWGMNPEASITNVKSNMNEQLKNIIKFVNVKEGRVLSNNNYQLVSEAIEALQALLDNAEPSHDTRNEEESQDESEEPSDHSSADVSEVLTPLKELVKEQEARKLSQKFDELSEDFNRGES